MRISDWSSDVCSSDLLGELPLQFRLRCRRLGEPGRRQGVHPIDCRAQEAHCSCLKMSLSKPALGVVIKNRKSIRRLRFFAASLSPCAIRSEEHTSELQSLMRISYAVFCFKKTKIT